MSSLTSPPSSLPSGAPDPLAATVVPTPWLLTVWRNTIARRTAKFGLVWILFIAFCAVFAPLLANSFPLVAKLDGKVCFPAADHLTPADVALPVLLVIAIILFRIKSLRVPTRILIFLSLVVIVGIASWLTIRPPKNVIYETYREYAREGRVQWAVYAPIPYSPQDRLRDQPAYDNPHPWPPSREHWMGTELERSDVLSQMIHACRIAMAVGFISTGIALVIGVVIGGLMGYFVGLVDLLGMRLLEIFSAIPTIYLLLTFVAAFPDYRNIYFIMIIIGLTSWVGDARFVRAEFLKLRKQDFVQAAIAAGVPLRSVLFRHLLPNALAPVLVSTSFGIAGAILTENFLSFLGLGVPLGDPSWGSLLSQAISSSGRFVWWVATFPGFAIFLTVLSYTLIGEAIRDALDPRLRQREG